MAVNPGLMPAKPPSGCAFWGWGAWIRADRLLGVPMVLALAWGAAVRSGATGDVQGLAYFEKRIRPLLVEHCVECHGVARQRGGLRLDTREEWQRGGDSGGAVVAGDPQASLLIRAVQWDDPHLQMPPKAALPATDIEALETWVRMGAPAPREVDEESGTSGPPGREEVWRDHWAYRPMVLVTPPEVRRGDWPAGVMDRFVLARLEAQGLEPAAPANAEVLVRRVHFDLTGLPPSPETVETYRNAAAEDEDSAWRALVDGLLGSRAHGERWARHWFDVVRFAESVTLRGFIFKEAWRYRDYVIEAFASDRRYDAFVREQLAGDLLEGGTVEERQRRQVATTFLALGNTNLEEQDKRQLDMDVVDEQLDTVGKALLGQTIGCARCHDHLFDPIPTRDYYAMAGIFASTRLLRHANVSAWIESPLPLEPGEEAAHAAYAAARSERERRIGEIREALAALAGGREDPSGERVAVAGLRGDRLAAGAEEAPDGGEGEGVAEARALLEEEWRAAEAEVKRLAGLEAGRPRSMGPQEAEPVNLAVHRRGSVHSLGETVPRGVLTGIGAGAAPPIPEDQSGRRELAEWLLDPEHPLTARVWVNRVWHWLFGAGLVRTVDNFGTTGEAPSHPELLDHLAWRFRREGGDGFGWSTRALIREIVLSRTYRQGGEVSEETRARRAAVDPENRLLAGRGPRALDAESLRDALLVVGGSLDPDPPEGPLYPRGLSADYGFRGEGTKRSVYGPVFRNAPDDFLAAFDRADPSMVVGARSRSVVAPQSLVWMNHPLVRRQAERAAARWMGEAGLEGEEARLERVFAWTLGRAPTEGERRLAGRYREEVPDEATAWADLIHGLFGTVDFRYLH